MAEYGRFSRLTFCRRFVNDILLSAPSIVVGLFVYEVLVATMGHFSAWAGGVALAMLVIPVVVRTTEDMLLLVPAPMREAAAAMGMPRWLVIRRWSHTARRAPASSPACCWRWHVSAVSRAVVVHGAQQSVLEPQSQRTDGQPADDDLPVRAQPLRRLAESRLDRRAHHHCHRAGAEYSCPLSSLEAPRAPR